MDKKTALKLLKGGPKGIAEWNRRREIGETIPNLAGIDLSGEMLCGVDFRGAVLSNAVLKNCQLIDALLTDANLLYSDLRRAKLTFVRMQRSLLRGAKLDYAEFGGANLIGADLSQSDLSGSEFILSTANEADFSAADLQGATFRHSEFYRSNFEGAKAGQTVFAADISRALGLDEVVHTTQSTVDISECILKFTDDLPEKFLRGCGLRDEEIAYFQAQIGKPIRHYTCFICYSTKDEDFATRLYNDFQAAGIRCWKWNEDAQIGRKLIGEIDQAIRRFDKLVLVASKSSLMSPYVLEEIERAIQKERTREARKAKGEFGGEVDVLFPVKLDNFVHDQWEHDRKADVTAKMIADAIGWKKDHTKYEKVLKKLIADLQK